MSEAEDRRLDYRDALERAREEAREVTASELTRQLESAGYPDQARKIVTFAGLSGCHQETAAAVIDKVTEQLTQLIRTLREGNFAKCALPGLAAAVLPEILKLPTVFFHFVYDVPDGTPDPTNADTWDAADEYHETDEYEPRNQLIAQQKTVRFGVLIALLRQMEDDGGEPKQLIRGPKNSNWRGAFQAGLKSDLPLRFKNEQILRPTAKNGADSPYWRFKTTAEATAYQQLRRH